MLICRIGIFALQSTFPRLLNCSTAIVTTTSNCFLLRGNWVRLETTFVNRHALTIQLIAQILFVNFMIMEILFLQNHLTYNHKTGEKVLAEHLYIYLVACTRADCGCMYFCTILKIIDITVFADIYRKS